MPRRKKKASSFIAKLSFSSSKSRKDSEKASEGDLAGNLPFYDGSIIVSYKSSEAQGSGRGT